ncbi:endoglucanase 14-like [Papaver somniferum]|uniref:endoglucanase 14-like n=1 Tax=Papaver somniferum TaxID=3469 RepID=UPI000E6FAFE1|nr:endoglucanase 14-like [Papaver somniferum]
MTVTKLLFAGGLDDQSETWTPYLDNVQQFICNCIQKGLGNFQPTESEGLLYFNEWNSLNYVTALLLLVLDYAEVVDPDLQCGDTLVTPGDLYNFVQLQVDYILGKNPLNMSYMDDITTERLQLFLTRMTSQRFRAKCEQGFHAWYTKTEPNPNILSGAVVGGPNKGDRFTDTRDNYIQN